MLSRQLKISTAVEQKIIGKARLGRAKLGRAGMGQAELGWQG